MKNKFGATESSIEEALEMSPGACGSIHGAISEIFLVKHFESLDYEVHRIKEKPAGGYNNKNPHWRGDFCIRKKISCCKKTSKKFCTACKNKKQWIIVECKGIKTNAEKRKGMTEPLAAGIIPKIKNILMDHSFKRPAHIKSIYDGNGNTGKVKYDAESGKYKGTFPKFGWDKKNPGPGVPDLTKVWKNEKDLNKWLTKYSDADFSEDAFWNLKAPVKVLQTHMPSTRTDPITGLKKTGPLKDEFGILAVDLFQRTGEHEFVFANSRSLNHQAGSPNHLQQNYTIDILVKKDGFKLHTPLLKPWFDDFDKCINDKTPVLQKMVESQLDER